MQAEKERIIRIIREMPEEKAQEVIWVVDEIEEDVGAPESVKVHNEAELKKFLEEGIEAANRGEVSPWEEVMTRLKVKYLL